MDNEAVAYNDWRAALGRDIRDRREQLGWNQKDLAEKATRLLYHNMDKEISTDTIHRVEHGRNTKTDMLHAIATALDVRIRVRLRPLTEKSQPTDTTDNRSEDDDTDLAPVELEQILPGIPDRPVTHESPQNLATTHQEINRVLARFISVSNRILARFDAVARDLGPRSTQETSRHRVGNRPKPPSKTRPAAKR